MARSPSPESLEALCAKYREMLRLRDDDAEGAGRDPRLDMRALAERFPGALREIDELPREEIVERIRTLEAAVAGGQQAPRWACFFVDYHGWLRAALRIKRLCNGAPTLEEALARVREQYRPEPDEPSLAAIGDDGVATIWSPPGGRLNPWVFARVAALHGVSADEVSAALFVAR